MTRDVWLKMSGQKLKTEDNATNIEFIERWRLDFASLNLRCQFLFLGLLLKVMMRWLVLEEKSRLVLELLLETP